MSYGILNHKATYKFQMLLKFDICEIVSIAYEAKCLRFILNLPEVINLPKWLLLYHL